MVIFSLIFAVYLFRIVNVARTFKNRNKFFSPCDGVLTKIQYEKDREKKKYTYIFDCGLLDQYTKYVPCDSKLETVNTYPKNHNKYPNAMVFDLSNQTYGEFSITIVPVRFGKTSTVQCLAEENTPVIAGDSLAAIPFGSTVILQCDFEIDITSKSIVNNATILQH